MKPANWPITFPYLCRGINMVKPVVKSSGRFIPYGIALFFVGLIALIFWFVRLAIHDYPGEVTADAYKKGLKYNSYLEKAGEQEKLKWQGDVSVVTHGLDVEVKFSLRDKND